MQPNPANRLRAAELLQLPEFLLVQQQRTAGQLHPLVQDRVTAAAIAPVLNTWHELYIERSDALAGLTQAKIELAIAASENLKHQQSSTNVIAGLNEQIEKLRTELHQAQNSRQRFQSPLAPAPFLLLSSPSVQASQPGVFGNNTAVLPGTRSVAAITPVQRLVCKCPMVCEHESHATFKPSKASILIAKSAGPRATHRG